MICSTCGTENRAGAKFCMECADAVRGDLPGLRRGEPAGREVLLGVRHATRGAAAPGSSATSAAARSSLPPRPDAVAERRVVSVLFADLVGFTAYSEGRDSEEVRELQTHYFEMVREIIGRYGGTVEKFIGDAVMALWGAPIAREDDAERAVRAALDLVDAVRGLGPGIQIRAGILTGEATVTLGATNQGMVAGDIVNTASRLQSAAAPSTVLVGEATQRAAGERDRVRGRRRPGPQGQGEPGPGLARGQGRRAARRRRSDGGTGGAVRRSRRGAAAAQGPLPRDRPGRPAAPRQRHRAGRDRQVPAGLGVPQVRGRPAGTRLVA